ncbi:MAG: hypothetical protein HXX16_20550 [Bacteroidales bacterium]|nr:hypothetical protein [Bacteroidales bacterium]
MNNFTNKISLNQMVIFDKLTESGKKRIIAQQLKPDQFRVQWYQLTRGRIKKSIEKNGDLKPIYEGINRLMQRVPENKRQETDKNVSVEALERYLRFQLPKYFKEINFTIIRPEERTITISDVSVIVAPDLIVKGFSNGQTVVGAVKFHICKSKPFDLQESKRAASTIYRYLKNIFEEQDVTILPEICCCFDIFSERIISAKQTDKSTIKEVNKICREIKKFYDAA